MRKLFLAIALVMSCAASAHDEGHGPKLSDSGKYGGIVSGVILKADSKKGAKAELVHKAELVRSIDGTIRVYLYDLKMVPLDIKSFDRKASAVVGAKVKGKYQEKEFSLELKDNVFMGTMSTPSKKPYNIDVIIKSNGRELLTAFDNLD